MVRRHVMRGSGLRASWGGNRAQASIGERARNSLQRRVKLNARSLWWDFPALDGTKRHQWGKRKSRWSASHEGAEARSLMMVASVDVQAVLAPVRPNGR
jgi:hypothetical protein